MPSPETPSFSDASEPYPPAQPPASYPASFHLFHKPRGGGGSWQRLNGGEALRVTKGKRKVLRAELRSVEGWQSFEVYLITWGLDGAPRVVQDGLAVSARRPIVPVAPPFAQGEELELHLMGTGGRQQLAVEVHLFGISGQVTAVRSVAFSASDNGKAARVGTEVVAESSPNPHLSPSPQPSLSVAEDMQRYGEQKRRREQEDQGSGGSREVGVVPHSLEVHGTVRAHAFLQFSDIRLKTDLTEIKDALRIVQNLDGRYYRWRPGAIPGSSSEGPSGNRLLGLIAQQVQAVCPEAVREDPATGYLQVAYSDLVPVLVEALKEHVERTSTEQKMLQEQLDSLRLRLDSLDLRQQQQQQPPPSPPSSQPTSPPQQQTSPVQANTQHQSQPQPQPQPQMPVASTVPPPQTAVDAGGPIARFLAEVIWAKMAEKMRQTDPRPGIAFVLLWKAGQVRELDLLLSKTGSVKVNKYGPHRVLAHDVKVLKVTGPADALLGSYQLAVDLKRPEPAAAIASEVQLLVFDFRTPKHTSPLLRDLHWYKERFARDKSLPGPPLADKWLIGRFVVEPETTFWAETYCYFSPDIPPGLVPPSQTAAAAAPTAPPAATTAPAPAVAPASVPAPAQATAYTPQLHALEQYPVPSYSHNYHSPPLPASPPYAAAVPLTAAPHPPPYVMPPPAYPYYQEQYPMAPMAYTYAPPPQ